MNTPITPAVVAEIHSAVALAVAKAMDSHRGAAFGPKRFLSVGELSHVLGLSESTIRRKTAAREWPSYQVGVCRRFDIEEIISIIKSEGESKDA